MRRLHLAILTILAISACSNETEQVAGTRRIKVEAYFDGDSPDTRVSLTQAENTLDLVSRWQEDDAIKVFLSDGATLADAGYERLESISDGGKKAIFYYSIPADFNSSISTYQFYCFSTQGYPVVSDWELMCNGSIIRSPLSSFRAPVFFESEASGSDSFGVFRHYGVYELLHISNDTDKAISFSLSGFTADRIWYRSKGALKIPSMEFVVSSDAARDPIDKSPAVTIPAHGSDIIVSWFIPNGNAIENAVLFAKIDNKEVQTSNCLSSQVVPQIAHAYHMYVAWDGTELKFKTDEEIPWEVMTVSATINPKTLYGSFKGSVTDHSLEGLETGFRVWKDNAEDYVEYDATLDGESAFSLSLTFDDYVGIANGASVKGAYKVSAYVVDEKGNRHHGNILEFTIEKDQPEMPTEPTEGELIDMGLSVKWASCNVGANEPQEAGGFYAWGELETKSSYDWSNYELCNGSENTIKKYCTQSSFGFVDNKTTLDFSDDVAYVTSQGKMRMPTAGEWQELKDKCVWTQMKYEGQDGYLVASPITGNAIFIPCNGFKTRTNYYNFYAPYYWSSELSSDSSQDAVKFVYINRWELNGQYRFEGLGVRPVSDSKDAVIDVTPSTLDFGAVAIGSSATKTVTITNIGDSPLTFHLAGGGDWFSFAPADEVTLEKGQSCEVAITFSPQSVSQTGTVIRVFSNASNGTQYIRCNGEGTEGTVAVPEIVDLGLPSGLKWASFNLGASKPEEYGDYYAWGETEPKTSYWGENYKWLKTDDGQLIKYCSNPGRGIVDNRTELELEDDAAHVRLGGNWRIPAREELNELMTQCSWTWITQDGVRGYNVTGPNGSNIFLPAAGAWTRSDYVLGGAYGYYWSSSLYTEDSEDAFNILFYPGKVDWGRDRRYHGLSIRPVYDDSEHKPDLKTGLVDLGLPSGIKWASVNLGASKPEEHGNYYAWGETTPNKQDFSWSTYRFGQNTMEMDKYNATDGVTVLHPEDDIVHLTNQGHWRMPTIEEWQELKDNCTWTEDRVDGVLKGFIITSSANGNSIYLPTGGYREGTELKDESIARYWASSLTNASPSYDGYNPGKARNLNESCFYWRLDLMGNDRCWGMQVRGVYDESSALLSAGELIDMGLSVKWASCNLDASVPEEAGHYYAWGETRTDKTDFSWETYQFGNGAGAMTKYFDVDELHYLDWIDDVVHARRGGHWRMPTIEEWQELQENCTWINSTRNGVRGYRIVSKINGNCIFLPIGGFIDGTQQKDGMRPRYWASSFTNALKGYDGYDAGKARCLNESCYYWRLDLMGSDRYLGMNVRGVYDDSADVLTDGETVDLGLSVEWASCNIGAEAPEDFGKYYGWGETVPHDSYSWENYAFSAGGTKTMTKYNDIDRNVILDADDDVAYTTSGGVLRMPTIDEIHELMENTTQTFKIRNGHIGYVLTSKINGNTIFLPIAGLMDGSQIKDGMRPRYWSASFTNALIGYDGYDAGKARCLNESCYYWRLDLMGSDRYLGMPVRGVKN